MTDAKKHGLQFSRFQSHQVSYVQKRRPILLKIKGHRINVQCT
jgi:hypothetical protein